MTGKRTILTFRVAEPHQTALRMVRRALAQHRLRVPAELDITARIREELGASLAHSVVLYVDDPVLLLEAVAFHRGVALLVPEPVVVSGDGRETEVLVRSFEALTEGIHPAGLRAPLLNLHERLIRAVETVAEREDAHLMARP